MELNPAEFDAVSKKINEGLTAVQGKIGDIIPVFERAFDHFYIPDQVKKAVRVLCDKLVEVAKAFCDKVIELVKGIAAPLRFYQFAAEWNDVAGIANSAAGQLKPDARLAGVYWKGRAADRYKTVAGVQVTAMETVGSVAGKVAAVLMDLAKAGLVFYAGIAGLVFQLLNVLVGAIAAIASALGAPAGVAAAIGDTAATTGAVALAWKALKEFLSQQQTALAALNTMANDNNKFPGGFWPDPTTSTFNDGSVVDGDADWSYNG